MEKFSSLMCFIIDKSQLSISEKALQGLATLYLVHYITMHVFA
jgi:hypothetical protein